VSRNRGGERLSNDLQTMGDGHLELQATTRRSGVDDSFSRWQRPESYLSRRRDDEVAGEAILDQRPDALKQAKVVSGGQIGKPQPQDPWGRQPLGMDQFAEIQVLGDDDPIAFISQLNQPRVGFTAMDFGKPDDVVPGLSQPLDDGPVNVFIGDQLQGDASLRNKVSSKPIVSAANR
jgi:hypothetical protein